MSVLERLFELQDISYKEFHSKLIPTVDADKVIGVRTPALRKLAKELKGSVEADKFLQELPHQYYEENNLHGFLIEGIQDYKECIDALERFLPFVDNWATCDMMAPKVFKKHLDKLESDIVRWIASKHIYMIRFGVCMMMKHYLDEHFDEKYLEWVADIQSEEYYINMVRAWFFATALTKQYEAAVTYLEEQKLDVWTHNKAIQKARESYRVPIERKEYLKSMKR